MTPEDEDEIAKQLRMAQEVRRGYADFFSWPLDRDLEEAFVVVKLMNSLEANDAMFFYELSSRGRGNDPPDCEAIDIKGARVAIEVTELVDGQAIHVQKKAKEAGMYADWASWSQGKFLAEMARRLRDKDRRFEALKDPPYPGGYVVVVYTDEPELTSATVREFLDTHSFDDLQHVDRAFLLLSYDPALRGYPYFELTLRRSQGVSGA